MKHIVVYVHGKGGSPAEAEHYKSLFPDSEVIGFDYRAQTPWEAKEEFPPFLLCISYLIFCVLARKLTVSRLIWVNLMGSVCSFRSIIQRISL